MNKSITLCLPGADFSSAYLSHVLQIQGYLLSTGWDVKAALSYTNNIYMTRETLLQAVLNEDKAPGMLRSELVLWIDDDNLLNVPSLIRLLDDLEAHPEADMVCGWYWIAADVAEGQYLPCVGKFKGERLDMEYLSFDKDLKNKKGLIPVDWCGFGAVLMRSKTLVKAGEKPFAPIVGDWPLGYTGDDISFCMNLHKRGGEILCDPEVFVPHLKLRAVQLAVPMLAEVPKKEAA